MIIFCDMDQVLVNFMSGARRAMGKEFNDPSFNSDEDRWKVLNFPGFWYELEWMPEATQIWAALKPHNPHILSALAPYDAVWCEIEKREWCKRELNIIDEFIHIEKRSEKRNYAISPTGPNLLIDDHIRNITEWTEAGGLGVLHNTVPETLIALKAYNIS